MNEFHLISSNAHGANYAKQEKIKLKNSVSRKLNEGEKVFCSNVGLDLMHKKANYFGYFVGFTKILISGDKNSFIKEKYEIRPGTYSYLEVEKENAKITTTLLFVSSAHYVKIANINENYERNQNLYIEPKNIKDLFALISSEFRYSIDENIDKNFYLSKHQIAFDYEGKVRVNFSHFNGGEKHVNHRGQTEGCIPSFFTDLSFEPINQSNTSVKVCPKNNVINKDTGLTSSYHIADFFTNPPPDINYQKMELAARYINEDFRSEIRDHEMPEKIFINKNVYVEKTNSFIPRPDQIGYENKNFNINFKISSNKKMTSFLCLNILSQKSNEPDNIDQVTLEEHILEIKGGCKINLKKLSPEKTIFTIVESIRPKDVFVDFSIKTISKEFIPLKETLGGKLFSPETSANDSISVKDMLKTLLLSIDFAPNFKNINDYNCEVKTIINDSYDGNISNDNYDQVVLNNDISNMPHENVEQSLYGENSSICALI